MNAVLGGEDFRSAILRLFYSCGSDRSLYSHCPQHLEIGGSKFSMVLFLVHAMAWNATKGRWPLFVWSSDPAALSSSLATMARGGFR
jgi:hypothetical protein